MVTVLVNSARVRVLTEDGQTLPVQLSAQWSSASQMNAEVFQVSVSVCVQRFFVWVCVLSLDCCLLYPGVVHGASACPGPGCVSPV